MQQKIQNFFFVDTSIWVGIVKLSLRRTRCFSSAANVLTSSPKILLVNKRDFLERNFGASDYEYGKVALMKISTVFGHVYDFACEWVLWNGTFQTST